MDNSGRMRKTYIASAVLLLVGMVSHAQEVGYKGGLTLSNINGRDFEVNPGLQVGAFARFGGYDALIFQAELLLTQKGSRNWQDDRRNVRVHYIELPIMFGFFVLDNLYFNAGIQPGMRIGGVYKYSENGSNQSKSIGSNSARFDYSTLMGLEYSLDTKRYVGVRYNHSFVPIQGYDNDFGFRDLPALRTVQIYMGIKLDGGLNFWKKPESE